MKRWAPVLERAGLALATAGAVLRWGVSGAYAGTGLNLFIHLLPILGLAAWFAARGMAGGTAWRFSGVEFAVLALAIVHVVSVTRASHRLPALEWTVGYLACGLFLVLAVQALGREGLRCFLLAGLVAASALALLQYAVLFPAAAGQIDPGAADLRRRHASYEPFAAFLGPNQLAGFLVLGLPLALGAAIDARPRGLAAFAPPALALGIGGLVLVLTGSLGGWVSLACGVAAFAVLALTRKRGRPLAVALGAGAAAVVLGLVLFSPLLERAAAKSHSLHVRRVYWQAAGRVIAESPLLGVGLGNFEDHYARAKGEAQQETRQVHNDYLQVLAETGLVGFIAFAAFLGLGLRRACAGEAEPAPDVEPLPRWMLPAGGAAAFLLLALRFGDPVLLVPGAAWVLAAGAAGRMSTSGPWTRIGAAAGFLGLLVHLSVDFLWVEPGVALALCAGLGLLLSYAPRGVDVRLPAAACGGAALALTLAAAPLFILAGPALAADRELAEARAAARPDLQAELAEAAQGHNPLLADAYEVYAAARFAMAGTDPLQVEAALQALDNAIALRPHHASHRVSAAHLNFLLQLHLRREPGEVARARADAYLARARQHQEKAVELYPAHAQGRYVLARILDLQGDRGGASREFAEALRFSDLASKELEDRKDLQLRGIRRIRALARTGRADAGLREAKRLLPLGAEGDVPRVLGAIRQDPGLLRLPEGELDEVTRPLIEGAIDELLQGR